MRMEGEEALLVLARLRELRKMACSCCWYEDPYRYFTCARCAETRSLVNGTSRSEPDKDYAGEPVARYPTPTGRTEDGFLWPAPPKRTVLA